MKKDEIDGVCRARVRDEKCTKNISWQA